MTGAVQRASGWLRERVRAMLEWPSRDELVHLREQRERLFAMLDAVEDQVILAGPDGRLRFANHAAGDSLREQSGRHWTSLVGLLPHEAGLPEALARAITEMIDRVVATNAPVTAEIAIANDNGHTKWQEQKISPVFTNGRMTGQVMIGRNIDERKRAQRRLELLSKVSTLVDTADLHELLLAIAQLSIPELADWSSVDMYGDATADRVYVAHRDPADAGLAERLRHFAPWRGRPGWDELVAGRSLFFPEVPDELIVRNAVDEEHVAVVRKLGLCSAIAVPLRVRGETVAVMNFATSTASGRRYTRDDLVLAEELARRTVAILERARLYADLKASEARFRIAVSAAGVAVFEQDRELRYRWYHNVGLYSHALGKTHEELFPPELAAQLTELKQHVLDTGEPGNAEIRMALGGEPRVMRTRVEPMRDALGAIIGVIGASTDITEEKHAQDDMARALTFRDQLMAILGHDLRNPLSAILASAGLLRHRPDSSPGARDQAARIERAARRMAEMIRTLLDLTQLRFHRALPVSPAPTDLGNIARAIVDEVRDAEPGRVIELDVSGDVHGMWDAARLAEVVSNLIGNALVHGDVNEPIGVGIDADGDEVLLRVHNVGVPIAPDVRARLFEPFRRGDGAPRGTGLGLGLYIVRQIVLAHAGTVSVESTLHEGTTFTVRLPRAARAPAEASAQLMQ